MTSSVLPSGRAAGLVEKKLRPARHRARAAKKPRGAAGAEEICWEELWSLRKDHKTGWKMDHWPLKILLHEGLGQLPTAYILPNKHDSYPSSHHHGSLECDPFACKGDVLLLNGTHLSNESKDGYSNIQPAMLPGQEMEKDFKSVDVLDSEVITFESFPTSWFWTNNSCKESCNIRVAPFFLGGDEVGWQLTAQMHVSSCKHIHSKCPRGHLEDPLNYWKSHSREVPKVQ